jgi:ribosomal protein S27E
MNRRVLLVVAVGVSVLVATVWLTFPRKAKSVVRDASLLRYMHCPNCLRESLYSPAAFDTPCLYCNKQLVATEESIKLTGVRNPYSRMLALILVEANCILGIVVCLLYFPPAPPEMEQFYTNCPNRKCKRRMRYPANRAGAEAQCPLCKTRFVNPTVEEQEAIGAGPHLTSTGDADE